MARNSAELKKIESYLRNFLHIIIMENNIENAQTHYQRYKNSIIASVIKHYQAHREEKNSYSREYKRSRYETDPEYREKVKAKALERYYKRKAAKSGEALA